MKREIRSSAVALSLLWFCLLAPATFAEDEIVVFPPWKGQEAQIEEALHQGKVPSKKPIGHGVTHPYRVELEYQGERYAAVWKPIDPTEHRTATESFRAEVAAYKLSRLVGLDRVPPTVERKIANQQGSLQHWVENVSLYADVQDTVPRNQTFTQDFARMRLFDLVIKNPDRNARNFLVDANGRIVLIDHSRALSFDAHSRAKKRLTPKTFDRPLIENLKTLQLDQLSRELAGLVPKYRLKALLKERDRVLKEVEAAVAEHGEAIYFD